MWEDVVDLDRAGNPSQERGQKRFQCFFFISCLIQISTIRLSWKISRFLLLSLSLLTRNLPNYGLASAARELNSARLRSWQSCLILSPECASCPSRLFVAAAALAAVQVSPTWMRAVRARAKQGGGGGGGELLSQCGCGWWRGGGILKGGGS